MLDEIRHGRHLTSTVAALARASLLRTGIHQGLFEALRTPHTPSSLSERLGMAPDLVEAWLQAVHAHGLVRRTPQGYVVGDFARWLLDSPDASGLHALLDQALLSYLPVLERLPELLKGAPRPEFGSREEAMRTAAVSRLLERRALAALGRVPGARRARRVLDVGCGHGSALIAFLRRHRDAHGLGVERDEAVAEEARRRLREGEVSRRAEVRTGDFMTLELPKGSFDLALLNQVLHYFSPAERAALLRRLRSRLAPGGIVAIQTALLTESPLARALGTAASAPTFDLVLRLHRNLHPLPDAASLAETLREAGFSEVGTVDVLPGGSVRIVWGRTPPAAAQ